MKEKNMFIVTKCICELSASKSIKQILADRGEPKRRIWAEQTCFNFAFYFPLPLPRSNSRNNCLFWLDMWNPTCFLSNEETCENMKPPVLKEHSRLGRFCTPKQWGRSRAKPTDDSARGQGARISRTRCSLQELLVYWSPKYWRCLLNV